MDHHHQQQQQQVSPQQWLLDTPRGAYTTLLAREGRLLVDWPTHLDRLARSLQALHTALGDCYASYYAWLQSTGTPEAAALQGLLAPAVRQALAAARQAEGAARDLLLVIVLPPASGEPSGLDVRVYARACGLPDTSPGTAVILGGPRGVPIGKDSGWVAERQPLERQKPGGTADVLLCTQDGRLLEGLVTNLFVVVADEGGARSGRQHGDSQHGGGMPSGITVWTASMGDGVVWGTARARVLQACRQLGVAVREEAPSMAGRAAWTEAFLTNSLRIAQPLARITCPDGNVWGHTAWQLNLPQAPGPVTAALQAALPGLLPAVDVEALPSAPELPPQSP